MSEVKKYLQAVENEIQIDEVAYALLNVSAKRYSYLPRPSKWFRQLHTNRLFLFVAPLIRWLWVLGGAYAFFLFEFLRLAKQALAFASQKTPAAGKKSYAVALSTRAFDIINAKVLGYEPELWLTLPWVSINERKDDLIPKVSVLALVSLKDLFICYFRSVAAVLRILANPALRPWSLQAYTAYRWFVVYQALKNLNGGHFIIAEHYDRWALLMDMLVAENKKTLASEQSLTIVQHGALASLTNDKSKSGSDFSYDIKNRLQSVDQLFVYDEKSEGYFKDQILSRSAAQSLKKVQYFKPTIELSPIDSKGKATVLFVGHPLCEELQIQVLHRLTSHPGIQCYYKPHPLAKASDQIFKENWQVIQDAGFFPDVNLLISYPSTLVNEYANLGKDAVIHAINLPAENSGEIANDVKLKLSLKLA